MCKVSVIWTDVLLLPNESGKFGQNLRSPNVLLWPVA